MLFEALRVVVMFFVVIMVGPIGVTYRRTRDAYIQHLCSTREGTNEVSTNGVTANFMCFDRGTFWVLRLTYLYLPNRSAGAYLFHQSFKNHYFCSGPISVDPIYPQPSIRRVLQAWDKWGHTVYHYSLVPFVFGYGLWYPGRRSQHILRCTYRMS